MPLLTLAIALIASNPGENPMNAKTLFDFRHEETAGRWQRLNDTVMGGVSSSDMGLTGEHAVFAGELSLENNGGFASVRSRPEKMDLSEFDAIALRVRGDGKRYALRLRTDDGWDGIAYHAAFDTDAGEWIDVVIPFDDFQPQFRGRRVPQAGPLDPAAIHTVGIMITDRQEGDFQLELAWIQAIQQRK